MQSNISLYSHSSNGSDASDQVSQEIDVTRLTGINETFQEKQLPLDVKDFDLKSDKKTNNADDGKNTSFFSNIRNKLSAMSRPQPEMTPDD